MSRGAAPLSVAIITYNEADNIRECLESVAPIASEILVLDSFSTDETRQICENFPNVVFKQHQFDGHIQQKNRALDLCQHTWILSIDADERLSSELQVSIQAFLSDEKQQQGINGVKFPRRTSHSGVYIYHGGWYPNARYRLIRKGKAHWGGENPHDVLIVDGKTSSIQGDLLHHTCRDLAEHVGTVNQFSSIVALTRYRAGRRFSVLRLLLMPFWKFLELYVIKLGLLDGMRGFTIAVTSTYSAFLKEAKLYELDKLHLKKPTNLGSRYESTDS